MEEDNTAAGRTGLFHGAVFALTDVLLRRADHFVSRAEILV
jgi:hypothetical protein